MGGGYYHYGPLPPTPFFRKLRLCCYHRRSGAIWPLLKTGPAGGKNDYTKKAAFTIVATIFHLPIFLTRLYARKFMQMADCVNFSNPTFVPLGILAGISHLNT